MKPGKRDQADIRRDHAAHNLDGFIVVAADFLTKERSDDLLEECGVAELVATGRSAIARRLRQLRVTTPSRLRTFDQALIQDLVRCAVDAMVQARSSIPGPAAINPANSAPDLTSSRSSKRPPGSH